MQMPKCREDRGAQRIQIWSLQLFLGARTTRPSCSKMVRLKRGLHISEFVSWMPCVMVINGWSHSELGLEIQLHHDILHEYAGMICTFVMGRQDAHVFWLLLNVCRFLDLSSSDSLCPSRAQDLQDPFWDRKTTWLWVKTLVKAKIAGHFKPIPTSNVPIQLNMAMDDSPLKTSIWCPNFPWIPELSIFQKASSHLATVLRGRRSQRSKGA